MDFPAALVGRLGVTDAAAKGLAGQVVGIIEDMVRELVSFGVASKIRDAVPELQRWQASTPTLPPGALRYDERDGWSNPGVPPEDVDFASTLARFRVPVERVPEVRGLALQFLSTRLDAKTFATIIKGVPHLSR
ncbi:MAG: hypothetical protein AMXMBFR34_04210 [Myxococcaceae bacterium]